MTEIREKIKQVKWVQRILEVGEGNQERPR